MPAKIETLPLFRSLIAAFGAKQITSWCWKVPGAHPEYLALAFHAKSQHFDVQGGDWSLSVWPNGTIERFHLDRMGDAARSILANVGLAPISGGDHATPSAPQDAPCIPTGQVCKVCRCEVVRDPNLATNLLCGCNARPIPANPDYFDIPDDTPTDTAMLRASLVAASGTHERVNAATTERTPEDQALWDLIGRALNGEEPNIVLAPVAGGDHAIHLPTEGEAVADEAHTFVAYVDGKAHGYGRTRSQLIALVAEWNRHAVLSGTGTIIADIRYVAWDDLRNGSRVGNPASVPTEGAEGAQDAPDTFAVMVCHADGTTSQIGEPRAYVNAVCGFDYAKRAYPDADVSLFSVKTNDIVHRRPGVNAYPISGADHPVSLPTEGTTIAQDTPNGWDVAETSCEDASAVIGHAEARTLAKRWCSIGTADEMIEALTSALAYADRTMTETVTVTDYDEMAALLAYVRVHGSPRDPVSRPKSEPADRQCPICLPDPSWWAGAEALTIDRLAAAYYANISGCPTCGGSGRVEPPAPMPALDTCAGCAMDGLTVPAVTILPVSRLPLCASCAANCPHWGGYPAWVQADKDAAGSTTTRQPLNSLPKPPTAMRRNGPRHGTD
jgi:hypothetical protein